MANVILIRLTFIAFIYISHVPTSLERTISIRFVHEESYSVRDIYRNDVIELNQDQVLLLEEEESPQKKNAIEKKTNGSKNISFVPGDIKTISEFISRNKSEKLTRNEKMLNILTNSSSQSSQNKNISQDDHRQQGAIAKENTTSRLDEVALTLLEARQKQQNAIARENSSSKLNEVAFVLLNAQKKKQDAIARENSTSKLNEATFAFLEARTKKQDAIARESSTSKLKEDVLALLEARKKHHRVRRKFSVDSMSSDVEDSDVESTAAATTPVFMSDAHTTTTNSSREYKIGDEDELRRLEEERMSETYRFVAVTLCSVAGFALIAYCFVSDPKACIVAFGTGCPCCLLCPCVVEALKRHSDPGRMMRNNMNKYIPGILIHQNGKVEHYDVTPEEITQISALVSEITDM